MADISRFLQDILDAIYGEQVRGSIHDAIKIINDVSEVILTTGTDVTSPTSSSEGYFTDSLYLNTNTFELWKCVGTDSWVSQGILKGDPGTPGSDGNKWYRGTGISGKAVNPTVYSGSGITDANSNDLYLNPVEGAVYHCVLGGDPLTATWSYDFTMTGGGGGSVVTWTQIQGSTGSTKIATIDVDGSTQDVYAPSGGGGGMLPYLYIDSEAGSTVTVNQPDGTVITPTSAGSGHWECELTGGYGTYVIHSVLAGQGDATQSLVVDTVMEYHVTDTHYDHTISFVAPSGSTVRIEGGTEIYTLTGTGSTQTQAVHSASTSFTVTATMDGNGKPYTFTTPSTTGQTTTIPSGTFDFGTINVSVAADFVTAGSTITCAKTSISTISKTAASTLTFRVPDIGEYTISGSVSGQTYSTTATVTSLSTPENVDLQTKAPMYPFETATDAQLAAMLDSYYQGLYDATEVTALKTTYLPVGAKRTIHLSQMAAYSPLEDTHFDASGADYEFVIIGHEHDDLVTSIGGKTKALLTLNQDRILYKNTTDTAYTTPSIADGFGKMNSTDTNVGGWKDSARRGWCNDTYFNALPLSIQGLVKTVQKLSSVGSATATIETTNDKVFLLSGIEISGGTTQTFAGEGTQYDYFATTTNQYKLPTHQSNLTGRYWSRSPASAGSSGFAYMYQTGVISAGSATGVNGLAPAFCI